MSADPARRGPARLVRGRSSRRPRSAAGRLAPGREVVARFRRMGPTGEALATIAGREVAVPYAAPGEEARIRILALERRRARAELVALRLTSPRVVRPPCPHFGRCGGCQWQHLEYPAQLEQKAALVASALARAGLHQVPTAPAIGWEPAWEFRAHLEAAVGWRDGRRVLGFYSWGGDYIVEARQCPVQHPVNVAALNNVRAAWEACAPLSGILRGLITRVGTATGEVMVGLSVSRRLTPDERHLAVRALLDAVPGLVSLMEVRAPRRGHLLAGRRADLLWGRPYVQEEVAGVRFHVPLLAEFPVNLRALPGLIELMLDALDATPRDTIVEPDAGIGGYTLHLALGAARVAAVTTAAQFDAAWANVRLNGLTNCLVYARNPVRALEKARRLGPVRLAFLHPSGTGLPSGLAPALRRAGVERVVYLGRTLGGLAQDTAALDRAGYRPRHVQPIDLSPHTSRVHALITAAV